MACCPCTARAPCPSLLRLPSLVSVFLILGYVSPCYGWILQWQVVWSTQRQWSDWQPSYRQTCSRQWCCRPGSHRRRMLHHCYVHPWQTQQGQIWSSQFFQAAPVITRRLVNRTKITSQRINHLPQRLAVSARNTDSKSWYMAHHHCVLMLAKSEPRGIINSIGIQGGGYTP